MAKSAHRLADRLSSSTNKISSLALAVDDTGTVLLVLLSGDPRGTEGAEGSKRGGALPDSVLTVLGGDDSDLSTSGSESLNLSLVRVFEMVGGLVDPWTFSDEVDNDLDDPVLL